MFVAAERWRNLPPEIVAEILRITGADGTKKTYNQKHLHVEYPDKTRPLVFVVGRPNQLGTGTPVYGPPGQQVATLDVVSGDFNFQGDWNRTKSSPDKKGQLDPSVSVVNTDAYSVDRETAQQTGKKTRKVQQNLCVFYSPPYLWPNQYLNELTPEGKAQFLQWRGASQTGPALSDTYVFHANDAPKKVDAILCCPDRAAVDVDDPRFSETVMAGDRSTIPVRRGMAVQFSADGVGVLSLKVMTGVVVDILGGQLKVLVVFRSRQLPPPANGWNMDDSAGFQTNMALWIGPDHVIGKLTCLPHALWQYKEQTQDVFVIAVSEIVVDHAVQEDMRTPANILQGLYGLGPLAGKVKAHIHRAAPVDPRKALKVALQQHIIHGTSQDTIDPYCDYIRARFDLFVGDKPRVTNTSDADNTLHLPGIIGPLFLRVVAKFLDIDSCQVDLKDGVFAITAQSWADVRSLLSPDHLDSKFDLTVYGHGVVEIFAPVVLKWEMYDTTRERDHSRSPDGFVAITFAGYAERGRHDIPGGIKDTRGHKWSKRQMNLRPSACPGFRL